jgi:hypothetical protein
MKFFESYISTGEQTWTGGCMYIVTPTRTRVCPLSLGPRLRASDSDLEQSQVQKVPRERGPPAAPLAIGQQNSPAHGSNYICTVCMCTPRAPLINEKLKLDINFPRFRSREPVEITPPARGQVGTIRGATAQLRPNRNKSGAHVCT